MNPTTTTTHLCRFCSAPLQHTFADLGMSPLSNAYLTEDQLRSPEKLYPLRVYVCEKCMLVQLPKHEEPEVIFGDYAYFSSFSDTWLEHCKEYTDSVTKRFNVANNSLVVELASNDGYLLQYFQEQGIPVLGIEPAKNVALAANEKGIPTIDKFFGTELAEKLATAEKMADLIIGNNVLAHVPDLNDFVAGIKRILKPSGIITMEFPHLMKLIDLNQFDTIYHEHFSYFSFMVVVAVFAKHRLTIFDVDELSTHGGSLRIYARHTDNDAQPVSDAVTELLAREKQAGFHTLQTYTTFQDRIEDHKQQVLTFLNKAKHEGKTVVGYGAPAKGNTMLISCGITRDLIAYTVDRSPHKQNHYLPATHIPIYHPDKFKETKPDFVLILPWNIKDEIMQQMAHIRDWEGQFVVTTPSLVIQK